MKSETAAGRRRITDYGRLQRFYQVSLTLEEHTSLYRNILYYIKTKRHVHFLTSTLRFAKNSPFKCNELTVHKYKSYDFSVEIHSNIAS